MNMNDQFIDGVGQISSQGGLVRLELLQTKGLGAKKAKGEDLSSKPIKSVPLLAVVLFGLVIWMRHQHCVLRKPDIRCATCILSVR